HRDLLRLRHSDGVYGDRAVAVDGAVLGPEAFALRFFAADRQDRLLLVNLGVDLPLEIAPEPLLAPPAGYAWGVQWSSEDPRYGGGGTAPVIEDGAWRLPGPAAVALRPVDSGPPDR